MNSEKEIDFFRFANITPKSTGLPFVVWIAVKDDLERAPQILIAPRLKAHPDEFVFVDLTPTVQVVGLPSPASFPPPESLPLLNRWVQQNKDVLVSYWNEEIDTGEALQALKMIEPEMESHA